MKTHENPALRQVQARYHAIIAQTDDDLRHAAQAALLRACVLAQGFVGLEAQVRRLCDQGAIMSKEAMKLALEALEDLGMKHFENTGEVLYKETFAVIKEALAQPAVTESHKQEPVAWRYALTVEGTEVAVRYDHANWNMKYEPFGRHGIDHGGKVTRKPVYTTPPQRKPLTDRQAERLYRNIEPSRQQDARSFEAFKRLLRVIEAAHGIKENT